MFRHPSLHGIWISKRVSRVERQLLQATSARISVLTQIIEGIRPIKLSAWEGSFLDLLVAKRAVECRHVMQHRTLSMMNAELGRANPVLSACFAFVCLGVSGHPLKAGDIFAAVTVFQALRLCLIMIPVGMAHFSTLRVVAARLESFLFLPEANSSMCALELDAKDTSLLVNLCKANFSWQGDCAFTLNDVLLQIRKGDRIAVIGTVASGKSSLLHAILGDMERTAGSAVVNVTAAQLAYIPQKAFVLSGTVAENILVGRPRDEARLSNAVRDAQLAADLAMLPIGLETVVGERGVTLSGGQQQRLSIARALYMSPALLIADDPLAAVDPTVAAGVFRGIMGGGSDRGVLMSLNQLHLLPHFGSILNVADGTVSLQESSSVALEAEVEDVKESAVDVRDAIPACMKSDGLAKGLVVAEAKQVGAVSMAAHLERSCSRTEFCPLSAVRDHVTRLSVSHGPRGTLAHGAMESMGPWDPWDIWIQRPTSI